MRPDRVYLDFNATSPLRPGVRERLLSALDATGNPSSVHQEGRRARAVVEAARAEVAGLAGCPADRIVFTSGATEAAALALSPDLVAGPDFSPASRLLVSATEHPAVLNGHRFSADRVTVVPVRGDGTLDLVRLEETLGACEDRVVASVQAANSETGVLQPVRAVAELVRARGGMLVCDCAQAAGRIDCGFESTNADVLLFSAHKLGGPPGVGALALRDGEIRLSPLVRGGGQERGIRGGTENVPAIAGFGAAATVVGQASDATRLAELRDKFERDVRALAPDVVIFGREAARLPNTSAFAIPGLANDVALISLDLAGFAVSTGSACSSGKVSRSHVLEAMGVNAHLLGGLIRVSLGWSNTAEDIERFIEALAAVLKRTRARTFQSAA